FDTRANKGFCMCICQGLRQLWVKSSELYADKSRVAYRIYVEKWKITTNELLEFKLGVVFTSGQRSGDLSWWLKQGSDQRNSCRKIRLYRRAETLKKSGGAIAKERGIRTQVEIADHFLG